VEVLADLDRAPDIVILPVGGGGLSAGMTGYFAQAAPALELHYVEPEGGASLAAALAAGQPVTLDHVDTFVDGAAVARLGAHTFAHLSAVDPARVHAVPEDRLCGTILEMLNVEGVVLEPAGALSVDALRDLADRVAGKRVVCVTSGGNFDFERLPEVKERSQRHAGVKKYFILRLPQRPGALRDFLDLLGPEDDIARFEYLKKSARNFGSVLLGIETSRPENFEALFARMEARGFVFTDITDDEVIGAFVL
jgi:threonine dehydratase